MLTATTYAARLAELRAHKLEQARLKRELGGPRDADEQGQVPLPLEAAEVVEALGGSGGMVRDLVLKGFRAEPNHPSGGFFGLAACGASFRRLLEAHPTYLHPANSMAGVYMTNFLSYRSPHWNPDIDLSHLSPEHARCGIAPGIGGTQHFCPDLTIGLELGWGGLREKIARCRAARPDARDSYDGLDDVVAGVQDWIGRHAAAARKLAAAQSDLALRQNLDAIAAICSRQVTEPPATFREACQWLVFFQAVAKMYNGSGEWGQLDELLRPFYERDLAAGRLDDEEALFHLACLLLSETAYIQLGGPDASGRDLTSPVSFLILEAAHRLGTPANVGIRVGPNCNRALLRRGLEILFEDRQGFPKFVADEPLVQGFQRLGYPLELARTRTYSGCHWMATPGREYCINDLIKIDFAKVFDVALREMMAAEVAPSTAELWRRFEAHLARAVAVVAEGIDLHLAHMHQVFPELVLDLLCHGPLERGEDASHGGVEYCNIGVDRSSLATAADSFAALEQRVEAEGRLSWAELLAHLDANWAGEADERARLLMRTIPRFGSGGSAADGWAERIARRFTELVAAQPTPGGATMVPGLFSWAAVIAFGQRLGGTMVNLNVLSKETLLAAKDDPEAYPDLIVRVTGFSAYFASLSDELRQFVIDRVVSGC